MNQNCITVPATNTPYQEYIQRDGRYYRYDPDLDCFYRVYDDSANAEFIKKHGWIVYTVILAAVVFCMACVFIPEVNAWVKTLPAV